MLTSVTSPNQVNLPSPGTGRPIPYPSDGPFRAMFWPTASSSPCHPSNLPSAFSEKGDSLTHDSISPILDQRSTSADTVDFRFLPWYDRHWTAIVGAFTMNEDGLPSTHTEDILWVANVGLTTMRVELQGGYSFVTTIGEKNVCCSFGGVYELDDCWLSSIFIFSKRHDPQACISGHQEENRVEQCAYSPAIIFIRIDIWDEIGRSTPFPSPVLPKQIDCCFGLADYSNIDSELSTIKAAVSCYEVFRWID